MYWKSKVVQEALAKICSSFVPCELEQCRSCLYGNFTNPIKRLLNWPFSPYLGFKNDRKNERLSQTADVCIKIILSYRWLYSLFSDPWHKNSSERVSKVSSFGYDPFLVKKSRLGV